MVQAEWRERLEACRSHNWFSLLHLGVMKLEVFDEAGAKAAWEKSLALSPSSWVLRNLGQLALRNAQPVAALEFYRQACEQAATEGGVEQSLAFEYLLVLHDAGEIETAWRFYLVLPENIRAIDTVKLLAAKVAFARDDLAFAEAALHAEYASIREGARDLSDLWFGLQAKRIAARSGMSCADAMVAVMASCPPPYHIDFRIVE
jgi:hypothetical protein